MRIDAYASQPQYLDHILPVWDALGAEIRGTFWTTRTAADRAAAQNVPGHRLGHARAPGGPVIIAAGTDIDDPHPDRPVCLLEHGAGQTYPGDDRLAGHRSYSGGERRGRVGLFLCPSPAVAERNRAAYSGARVKVVGCPKMDRWYDRGALEGGTSPSSDDAPVVAISFHWNLTTIPETRWAWPHYRAALPDLARKHETLGHGHPKAWPKLAVGYERAGIEPARDFETVLERADLYIADNTSTLPEFASTGRPVLVLNAPWYRRDIEHGLRFWSHVPGLQVDEPDQLLAGINRALADPPEARELRERAVDYTFPLRDGQAARRAAAAVLEWAA